VFFLLTAFFVFRWGIGSSMAEQADDIELVRLAERWSPHDWQPYSVEAQMWLRSRAIGDEKKVVAAYERAVSLSPHDYRLWLELGLARERAEDVAGAEKAFRQATTLAPNYAYPHWQLGNFLLRRGQLDEAFKELRFAGGTMESLRPQVAAIAWNTYKDVTAASNALGQTSSMKAELAKYLTQQAKMDEALQVWNSLSDAEKRLEENTIREMLVACMKAKRFRAGWALMEYVDKDESFRGQTGVIINPGFEGEILAAGTSYFGWQIGSGEQPLIAIDASQRQEGTRSLLVYFTSVGGFEIRDLSQLIVVESSSRYSLEFVYSTNEMKASGPVKLEVVDASNNYSLLGSSKPLLDGTHPWKQEKIEFSTQHNTEGIIIRLARDRCADNNCPIFGKVWYDNFRLQRLNN
jgi:hypothetical protein